MNHEVFLYAFILYTTLCPVYFISVITDDFAYAHCRIAFVGHSVLIFFAVYLYYSGLYFFLLRIVF